MHENYLAINTRVRKKEDDDDDDWYGGENIIHFAHVRNITIPKLGRIKFYAPRSSREINNKLAAAAVAERIFTFATKYNDDDAVIVDDSA